jgi:cell division protease FtsH
MRPDPTPRRATARDGDAPVVHNGEVEPRMVTLATSFVQDIQDWSYQWSSVVMILFFVVIIYVMLRMLKVMPRVKPQQIKPSSSQSVAWKDIAGVDEAKAELQEIVEFLRDPKQFEALGAKVPKGILLRGADFSGEKDQTLNQLLVEMDGFATNGRLVVIAASNLLDKLDPALLRPGRFDRQIFVTPPDVRGRKGILGVHTRDKPLHDVDLGLVAAQTSGLTGADLANICNEAAIFAARRGGKSITDADFDHALERVIAGVQSHRVLNDHEKRVVAHHEAGHALCGELLPSVDRVHRISIVPRGRALGYTLNLPAEDRYLKTREELLDYMTVLLGGRVAEQIVFGAITTGASDDLKRVADIAHLMVHDYAMGSAGVGRTPDGDVRLSETTLRLRDEERRDLIEEARRAARRMIVSHRAHLDALASELLENEVLDRDAIERIMTGVPRLERRPGVGLRVVAAAVPEDS